MMQEELKEIITKGTILNEKEILNMSEGNRAVYCQHLAKWCLELMNDIEALQASQKNMVRIIKERKNQENGLKCKENGFVVERINETKYQKEPCFKIKIRTPYSTEAFNFKMAKLQFKKDIREVSDALHIEELIIIDFEKLNKYKNMGYRDIFWEEHWEADLINQKCWYVILYSLNALI